MPDLPKDAGQLVLSRWSSSLGLGWTAQIHAQAMENIASPAGAWADADELCAWRAQALI